MSNNENQNREVFLTAVVGFGNEPTIDHFGIRDANDRNKKLEDGEIRVKTTYVSVDPYIRGRFNNVPSFVPPIKEGEVIQSGCCGVVVESKNNNYKVGDTLTSIKDVRWPWREFVIFNENDVKNYDKLSDDFPDHLIPHSIGQLGMPGLTAYFGVIEVAKSKPGQTFVVSGGAGACGSIAGQIAKIMGSKVIGISSTKEKLDFMRNDLGFDDVVSYSSKSEDELYNELKSIAPEGIDAYFDNVGGIVSNAVLRNMNENGRVAICGQISRYNTAKSFDPSEYSYIPPNIDEHLKQNKVFREWFMVSQFASNFEQAQKQLVDWTINQKIKVRQTVYDGIQELPRAFIGLFKGENIGKFVVRLN